MRTETAVVERTPSESVIQAVADREDVDPTALEVPLFHAIDPDALDAFVGTAEQGESTLEVEFDYHGYEVTVTSDGSVTLSRVD